MRHTGYDLHDAGQQSFTASHNAGQVVPFDNIKQVFDLHSLMFDDEKRYFIFE